MDKNVAQTVTKNKPKTKDLILFIVTCILLLLTIISLILEVGLFFAFIDVTMETEMDNPYAGLFWAWEVTAIIIGVFGLLVPILIFLCLGLWFSLKLANKKRGCPAWMQVSSRVFAWVYAIIIALFVVLGGLIFWTMLLFG